MSEQVILVDKDNNEIGIADKLHAHQEGLLHRAYSIIIFNNNGEMLLQQRAKSKYHSGGLWSNACCSHPTKGLTIEECMRKRLNEEMGIKVQEFHYLFDFIYNVPLDNNLIEHELDYVYVSLYDGDIILNKEEAMDYKYIPMEELYQDIARYPEDYTEWFKLITERLQQEPALLKIINKR